MPQEKIKISELKRADYNPRKISSSEMDKLKRSISSFGFVEPVIINKHEGRENTVIGGHQRIDAAEALGIEEVPYHAVDLPLIKEKALNIALNKIRGSWDTDKLLTVLREIEKESEEIVPLTGFDDAEINYLLELEKKEKEQIYAQETEDKIVGTENEYGIKTGDIITLDGKHKIICGDSTDPQVFRKLLGEKKLDLVVTSPPYNLDIKYGKYRDNKDYKEYLALIKAVFSNAKDFLNKGRYICVNVGRDWGPINIPAKYNNLLEDIGYVFFRDIYWIKPLGSARGTITARNPFPRYYVPKVQTEIIQIYSFEENPKYMDNLIVYKLGEEKDKVKEEKIPGLLLEKYIGNAWTMMTETTLGRDHPAPFPVQLPFNCMRFFTLKEEKVLDPFLGSGTSLIAADQLKRTGYGIEIDVNYVNLAIKRFKEYRPEAKIEVVHDGN